jgi:hypothetical protein
LLIRQSELQIDKVIKYLMHTKVLKTTKVSKQKRTSISKIESEMLSAGGSMEQRAMGMNRIPERFGCLLGCASESGC